MVWGRGTGRSGIATVAAGLAAPAPESEAVAVAEGAATLPELPPASCLLSQAAEASKIRSATRSVERMVAN